MQPDFKESHKELTNNAASKIMPPGNVTRWVIGMKLA